MELIRVIRAKPRIMEFDKLRQILQCHSMVSKMTPSDLHMRGTVSYGIHCSRKFILAGSQQDNNVHLIDILNVALSLPDLQNDLGVGGLLLVLNHPSWVCSCKIFSNGNFIATLNSGRLVCLRTKLTHQSSRVAGGAEIVVVWCERAGGAQKLGPRWDGRTSYLLYCVETQNPFGVVDRFHVLISRFVA